MKPGGWNVRETGTGCKDGDGERTESGIDRYPGDEGGGEADKKRVFGHGYGRMTVKRLLNHCRKLSKAG